MGGNETEEISRRGNFPAYCRPSLVQRSTHAACIIPAAIRAPRGFCRAACDIGLSSLAGGNDYGLLIAHGIDFYLFMVINAEAVGLLSSERGKREALWRIN